MHIFIHFDASICCFMLFEDGGDDYSIKTQFTSDFSKINTIYVLVIGLVLFLSIIQINLNSEEYTIDFYSQALTTRFFLTSK